MHRNIVNFEILCLLTVKGMANERYFPLIYDKRNVMNICSSGNVNVDG
jgi:hypothetical protein